MERKYALFVAIVLGLVAVFLLKRYTDTLKAEVTKQPQTVAVARSNLVEGTVIDPSVVVFKDDWPEEYSPSTAFNRDTIDMAYGHQLLVAVMEGDPLLSGYLTRPQPRLSLADMLAEGERAVTLPCDEVSGVAGMIMPNDRIDIMASFKLRTTELMSQDVTEDSNTTLSGFPIQSEETVTYTLLQNVTVLATDQLRAGQDDSGADRGVIGMRGYNTLTLALTPQEARLVTYALQEGSLTFALRPREETVGIESDESKLEFISQESVYQQLVTTTQERKRRLTVLYGGQASQ